MDLFNSDKSSVVERRLMLNANIIINANDNPPYNDIVRIINDIPSRDVMSISFTDDCDNKLSFQANSSISETEYENYINDARYGEKIYVTISIEKNIKDNKLSIYCLEKFMDDLLSLNEEEVMKSFSKLLKDRGFLIFTLFDSDIIFKTKSMCFVPETNSDTIEIHTYNRLTRLNECQQASYFVNATLYELIPDDFSIEVDYSQNPLSSLFKRISTILSLVYISSSSAINNNVLKLKISGQRVINYSYSLSDVRNNQEIYKIYSWCFTDGNPIDKGILARNIISLHCKYIEITDLDSKTIDSIQSNYNLYIKENVSQYIELKNRLSEFINEIVSKTGEMSLEILDKLKNNFIALFVFFFSVILTNIVTTQNFENIFSKDITFVLELILACSMGYILVCLFEVDYKIKKITNAYKALKNNYSSLFTPNDLNEAFCNDKLMDDTNKEVHRRSNVFALIWLIILLFLFVLIEIYSPNPVFLSLFK